MNDKEKAELKDKIIDCIYEKGSTVFAIADTLGLHTSTAYTLCIQLKKESLVDMLPDLSKNANDNHVFLTNEGRFFAMNSSFSKEFYLTNPEQDKSEDSSKFLSSVNWQIISVIVAIIGILVSIIIAIL